MNLEQLKLLNEANSQVGQPVTVADLGNRTPRTLIHGYDGHILEGNHMSHLYLDEDGKFQAVRYDRDGLLMQQWRFDRIDSLNLPYCLPIRDVIPAESDFEFCRLLKMKNLVAGFTFESWSEPPVTQSTFFAPRLEDLPPYTWEMRRCSVRQITREDLGLQNATPTLFLKVEDMLYSTATDLVGLRLAGHNDRAEYRLKATPDDIQWLINAYDKPKSLLAAAYSVLTNHGQGLTTAKSRKALIEKLGTLVNDHVSRLTNPVNMPGLGVTRRLVERERA